MKTLPIIASIVLVLLLTSCSTIGQYVPGQTNDNVTGNETDEPNVVDIEDPFEKNESETGSETLTGNETDDTNQEQPENTTQEAKTTIEIVEGDVVDLTNIEARDPDGDTIEYTYSEPIDENGKWQTEEGDEGTYTAEITASDGYLKTTEEVTIKVKAMNKPPVIECPDTFKAKEGERIDLPCTFYDREGDEVSYEVSGFMDSLTGEAGYDDAGEHEVTVTATDGDRNATHTIDLFIKDVNRAPQVVPIGTITVEEEEVVDLDVEASDPDGDNLTIEYPSQFDENGEWNTTSEDIGTYELEVIVSDGHNDVTVPVNIIVEDVNRLPRIEPIDNITVKEGETVNIPLEVSDPDSEDLDIDISGFMNSTQYTTTYDDAGEHEVKITVSDEESSVSQNITVTVENVNRPPVFTGFE
ncbi:MAG: Ig-like domain-containing protein [Nanoarchaeota archaeon]